MSKGHIQLLENGFYTQEEIDELCADMEELEVYWNETAKPTVLENVRTCRCSIKERGSTPPFFFFSFIIPNHHQHQDYNDVVFLMDLQELKLYQ